MNASAAIRALILAQCEAERLLLGPIAEQELEKMFAVMRAIDLMNEARRELVKAARTEQRQAVNHG